MISGQVSLPRGFPLISWESPLVSLRFIIRWTEDYLLDFRLTVVSYNKITGLAHNDSGQAKQGDFGNTLCLEDQIDSASLQQAVVTAGVFTDKFQLLSGDVTARFQCFNFNIKPVDVAAQFEKLHAMIDEINAKKARNEAEATMTRHQLSLPPRDAIADSGAETGSSVEKAIPKRKTLS